MIRKSFTCILIGAGIIAYSAAGFAQDAGMDESRDANAGKTVTPSAQAAVNPAAVSPQKDGNASQETVTGTVREIASDKSSIVVGTTKLITTPAFVDESYMEVGDKVKVSTAKTPAGLAAVECSYVFDDMPETIAPEAPAEESSIGLPAEDLAGEKEKQESRENEEVPPQDSGAGEQQE